MRGPPLGFRRSEQRSDHVRRAFGLTDYAPGHNQDSRLQPGGNRERHHGRWSIFNRDGACLFISYQYPYTTGGLVVDSPAFGSDCFVVAIGYSPFFEVMAEQVDLSAPSTTVVLTQDSGAFTTTVNVAGDTAGYGATLLLKSPYGAFHGSKRDACRLASGRSDCRVEPLRLWRQLDAVPGG